MKPVVVLFGAGGHARVVLDLAGRLDLEVAFLVSESQAGFSIFGVPVIADSDDRWQSLQGFKFLVAVGDNVARERIYNNLLERGGLPLTLIHPFTSVSPESTIGAGTVVCAGAVINPASHVGDNCIINTSASLDHDCALGQHSHICPGVRLAGTVRVGSGTMVGTGACVIPGVSIGSNCLIGAGAVVVRNVPDNRVVYGNPARVIRELPPRSAPI